jgi:hypothetical protein
VPIIPRGTETVRMNVSSPVPIAGTTDARFKGEVMSRAGSAVADFAEKQINFDRSLRRDESEAELRNQTKLSAMVAERSGATTAEEYQKAYSDDFNPKMQQIVRQYAGHDPLLQTQIGSAAKIMTEHGATEAFIRGAARQEKENNIREEKNIEEMGKSVYSNPDQADTAYTSGKASIQERVAMRAYSPEEGMKKMDALANVLSKQRIEGYVARGEYKKALSQLETSDEGITAGVDPLEAAGSGLITQEEAQRLNATGAKFDVPIYSKGDKVKLSPESTAIMKGMSAHERSNYIDMVQARAKQDVQERVSTLARDVGGLGDLADSGAPTELVSKAALQVKQRINTSGMKGDQKRLAMANVDMAVVKAEALNVAAHVPASQFSSISTQFDKKIDSKLGASEDGAKPGDLSVAALKITAQANLDAALKSLETKREKDGSTAGLVASEDLRVKYKSSLDRNSADPVKAAAGVQAFKEYKAASIAWQKSMGIKNVRATTLQEAYNVAERLRASLGPRETAANLMEIEDQYGENFSDVLAEVATIDKSYEGYAAIAHMPKESWQRSLSLMQDEKAINKQFEPLSSYEKALKRKVDVDMSSYGEVVNSGTNDLSASSHLNVIKDQIVLRAKSYMIGSGMEYEAAASLAHKEILGDSYHNIRSGSANLLVPRTLGEREVNRESVKMFDAYFAIHSRPEGLLALGIKAPRDFTGADKKVVTDNKSGVTTVVPGIDATRQYAEVLADKGVWVSNKSFTGARLMEVRRDGMKYPVSDSRGGAVEVLYKDILSKPPANVVKASESFLGGIFGY